MLNLRITTAITATALSGVALAALHPAATGTGHRPQSFRLTTTHKSSSNISVDQVSQNWTGLIQDGTSETSVGATWSPPSSFVSRAQTESALAEWVGLGGANSNSLIQIGTLTTASTNGTPITKAFWENIPNVAITGATIPSGTAVTADISPVTATPNKWLLSLTTPGSSSPLLSTTVTLTASQAKAVETSADWITEAPSTANNMQVPLAPVASTTMHRGWSQWSAA